MGEEQWPSVRSDEPLPWSRWVIAPNVSLLFRGLFYLYWLWRAKGVLLASFDLGSWMWHRWGLIPFIFGIGEGLMFALPWLMWMYGAVPYAVYAYSKERHLGSLANGLLNAGAFLACEVGWWLVDVLVNWLAA